MPGKRVGAAVSESAVQLGAKKAILRRKKMKPYQTRTMLEKERLYQVQIPTKRKRGVHIPG